MANLESLSFSIGVVDNATKALDALEQRLKKLQENKITITVDVSANLEQISKSLQDIRSLMGGEDINALATRAKQAIENLEEAYKRLSQNVAGSDIGAEMLRGLGDALNNVKNVTQQAQADSDKALSDIGERNTNRLETAINRIKEAQEKVYNIMNRGKMAGMRDESIQAMEENITRLEQYRQRLLALQRDNAQLNKKMSPVTFMSAEEKQQMGMGQTFQKQLREFNQVEKAVTGLKVKIDDLNKAIEKGDKAGVSTTGLRSYVQELQSLLDKLHATPVGSGETSQIITEAQNTTKKANAEKTALQDNIREKERAEKAAQKLAEKEYQLGDAIRSATKDSKTQSRVLNDLQSMMLRYLSVYAAQRFLSEMVSITGELELQQKSLEIIISSSAKAQELYSDIRNLSQMSPYTIQDLMRTTRQLTAFGIETKDLYADMKALSDIGAGLNVDVHRLVLAFGHVRSYGYLSGIQTRQLQTAGIDIMGELVKYYNRQAADLKARGADAKTTNRMALYKRMRKREIPFEDVQDVILAMDSPGGRFYNMQLRQFETLGGKLRNLRDNYNIMMSEIGESNMGVLMGMMNMLNEVTDNWKKYANMLKVVLIPLGSIKLAMMAVNKLGLQQTRTLSYNIMDKMRSMGFEKGYMSYLGNIAKGQGVFKSAWAKMSPAESAELFESQLTTAFMSGDITKMQLRNMALSAALPEHYRKIAGSLSGLTQEQAAYIAGLSGMQRGLAKLRIGFAGAGEGIARFGSRIKRVLTSSTTWIMAIITAITAAMNHLQQARKMSEAWADSLKESGEADAKSINEMIETYTEGMVKRSLAGLEYHNGRVIRRFSLEFDADAINASDLTGALADLKEKLQIYSPMYDADLVDIAKMNSQYEQFKAIIEKIEAYRRAEEVTTAFADDMGTFNKLSAGRSWIKRLFNDNYIKEIQDYQRTMKKGVEKLSVINEEALTKIDEGLGGALTKIKADLNLDSMVEALQQHMMTVVKQMDDMGFAGVGGVIESSHFKASVYNLSKVMPDIASLMENKEALSEYSKYFNRLMVSDVTLFARNLNEQRREVENASDFMGQRMASIIANYADDPNMATSLIAKLLKSINTEAGVSQMDTVGKDISDMLLDAIQRHLPVSMQKLDITGAVKRGFVIARFNQMLEGQISSTTTDEEAKRILDETTAAIESWAESEGFNLHKLGMTAGGEFGNAFFDAVQAALNNSHLSYNWQERLIGTDGIVRVNTALISQLKKEADIKEATDLIQEDFKKLWEEFPTRDSLAKNAFSRFMGISYEPEPLTDDLLEDPDALLSVLNKRAEVINAYIEQSEALIKTIAPEDNALAEDMISQLEEEIRPSLIAVQKMIEDIEAMQALGQNPEPRKQETYKDEYSKRWDERIRIMKEAYDWYDKWDERVGEEAAFEEVNKRYNQIFEEWRTDKFLPMQDFKAEDIKDYLDYIEDIREKALNKYNAEKSSPARKFGEEALRVYRQAVATLNDVRFDNFTKAADRFKSTIEVTMDELMAKWAIFDDVRSKTGSEALAARMSGISGFSTQADLLRSSLTTSFGQAGGVGQLTFDVYMDKEGVRAMFERAIPLAETERYKESLAGLIDAYAKWQKAQRETDKEHIQVLVDTLGSAVDFQSKVQRIEEDYRRTMEALDANAQTMGADEYSRAVAIASANRAMALVQAQDGYQMLMDGVVTANKDAMRVIRQDYIQALNQVFAAGRMTAKEYANSIQQINDKMQEIEDYPSLMRSYMEGGLEGISSNLGTRGRSMLQEGASMFKEGIDTQNQGMMAMGSNAMQAGQGMMTAALKMQSTIAIIDLIIHGINNMIQGLKGTYDELQEMFDALGKDTDRGAWESVGTFLDTFSKASQSATEGWESLKKGDVGGVLKGVVGSITRWVTGYAKANDKRIETLLKDMERDRRNIGRLITAVERAKETQLGPARADDKTIDELNQMISGFRTLKYPQGPYNVRGLSDDTFMAIEQTLATGSAYMAELALLLVERDKIQAEYMQYMRKKKKDKDKIDQYIKDLDEANYKVEQFFRNFAKEMWGIDLKGWAAQLSDALVNAFRNGEDAAKAYADTVKSIIQQMVNRMMAVNLIEPIFKTLEKKLFGDGEGIKGIIDPANPDSIKDVVLEVAKFFSPDGEGGKMITMSMEFLHGINEALKDQGIEGGLRDTGASALLSSIQGTSEETSSLIAGYINALRQDVASNNIQLTQFVSDMWPDYVEQMAAGLTTLNNIDKNVGLIYSLMAQNGALFNMIKSMDDRFRSVTTGASKVYVN